jgi:hypothetical protein
MALQSDNLPENYPAEQAHLSLVPDWVLTLCVVKAQTPTASHLDRLLAELTHQAANQPVEVLTLEGDEHSPEAWLTMIEQARGKYIATVEAGDWVTENYVSSLLKQIQDCPEVDLLVFNTLMVKSDDRPWVLPTGVEYLDRSDNVQTRAMLPHMCWRRSVLLAALPVHQTLDFGSYAKYFVQKQLRLNHVLYLKHLVGWRNMEPEDLTMPGFQPFLTAQGVALIHNANYLDVQNRSGLFPHIYHSRSGLPVGGPESSLENTRTLRTVLPMVVHGLGIKTLLDVPGNNWHWMKLLELKLDKYIGCDPSPARTEALNAALGSSVCEFLHADALRDSLPQADLIFSREWLYPLSRADMMALLKNFKASGATYLLISAGKPGEHQASTVDSDCLPDLTQPPFRLPTPLLTVYEDHHPDKALHLWRMESVPDDFDV